MSIDKSKSMLINKKGKSSDVLKVNLNGEEIKQVHDTKYLGIQLDENINWESHLEKLHCRIMSKLAVLRRLSKFLPKKMLEMIYNAMILPCIDYGDTVWGTTAKALKETQRLQNAAARVITGNFDYVNVRGADLVRELKWQTMAERQRFHTATLMYKCIYGLAPNYLCDQVSLAREVSSYQTRQAAGLNVIVPSPNKEVFKKSFLYNGAIVWNSLPAFLKESQSVLDFKARYKRRYF